MIFPVCSLDWWAGIVMIKFFNALVVSCWDECSGNQNAFFFFFFPSKILPFCKFLPGRNPKQPSQLPCLLSPHVLAAHLCFLQLWSLFGLQLSVILLSRSLGLQLPQQVEQKSMLKTLKERSGGEKWKEMSRRGKKRQNKHSCRVRTDYIFIFFKKVSGYVLKSSCCCSFQK